MSDDDKPRLIFSGFKEVRIADHGHWPLDNPTKVVFPTTVKSIIFQGDELPSDHGDPTEIDLSEWRFPPTIESLAIDGCSIHNLDAIKDLPLKRLEINECGRPDDENNIVTFPETLEELQFTRTAGPKNILNKVPVSVNTLNIDVVNPVLNLARLPLLTNLTLDLNFKIIGCDIIIPDTVTKLQITSINPNNIACIKPPSNLIELSVGYHKRSLNKSEFQRLLVPSIRTLELAVFVGGDLEIPTSVETLTIDYSNLENIRGLLTPGAIKRIKHLTINSVRWRAQSMINLLNQILDANPYLSYIKGVTRFERLGQRRVLFGKQTSNRLSLASGLLPSNTSSLEYDAAKEILNRL